MAHDSNGHIYIDTNTTPHTGISVGEVAAVLGAAAGEELCSHANIKKEAKYKPMDIGDMFGYTDAQAKLANYGLLVPYYTQFQTHTSFNNMVLDIDDNSWTRADNYEQGKAAWQNNGLSAGSWHRLLDFNNYLHSVVPIMAAVTTNKDSYTAAEGVQFVTNAGGTSPYNLCPADIRLILNDAISAENMYLGVYIKNNQGRFYKIIGRCLSVANQGHGTITFSDDDFVFLRANGRENILVCMFLSDTNLNNGQVGTNIAVTGRFIPLTMSRAIVSPYFAMPLLNFDYDPTSWYHLKNNNSDAIFVIKSTPDSDYTWAISLEAEYTSGDSHHNVLASDEKIVELHREYDDVTGLQMDLYLRLETDRANAEIMFDLYACESSSDHYEDVVDEDTSIIGSPIVSETLEIVSGEILDNPYAVQLMQRAILTARLNGTAVTQICTLTD